MPKAKPVSLHPLSFEDALKAIVQVDPEKVGITSKRRHGTKSPTTKRGREKPTETKK